MQKIIFLLSFLCSFSLYAQNGPFHPLSARSNGIANASFAFNDINSLFNNQAGLADLEDAGILLSADQTFQMPISNHFGAGFAMPTSSGTFGLHFDFFEFGDFKQAKTGLAYARKLSKKLSAGVQFNLLGNLFLGNEKRQLFTSEIGLQYELSKKILLGVHFNNPAKLEIIENEFLPRILRLGATYSSSEKLLFHVELEQDFDLPLVFKGGIEYELLNNLWARIGFQNKPSIFNFGLGCRYKRFRFDIASYYQQGIDYTPRNILGPGFILHFGVGFDFVK